MPLQLFLISPILKSFINCLIIIGTTIIVVPGLEAVSQCHSEAQAEESRFYNALIL